MILVGFSSKEKVGYILLQTRVDLLLLNNDLFLFRYSTKQDIRITSSVQIGFSAFSEGVQLISGSYAEPILLSRLNSLGGLLVAIFMKSDLN